MADDASTPPESNTDTVAQEALESIVTTPQKGHPTGYIDPRKYIRTYAQDLADAQGVSVVMAATPSAADETSGRGDVPDLVNAVQQDVQVEPERKEKPFAVDEELAKREEVLARLRAVRSQPERQAVEEAVPQEEPAAVEAPAEPARVTEVPAELPAYTPISSIFKASEHDDAPEPEVTEEAAPETVATPAVSEPAEPPAAPAPDFAPFSLPNLLSRTKQAASPLHTYSGDFADHIDEKKASTFSVLAAQADTAPVRRPTSAPSKSSLTLILAGAVCAVLVIGGGVALFAAYRSSSSSAPLSLVPTVTSLIPADETRELSSTDPRSTLVALSAESLPEGSLIVGYATESTTTATGILHSPISGVALLQALALGMPDIVLRNTSDATIGIIHAGSETRPFIILRTSSYERTRAGMLTWEGTVGDTLTDLYPAYPATQAPAVTPPSTSTSTALTAIATPVPSTSVSPLGMAGFADAVVANHDVRELKDEEGNVVLIYGYRDKETLLIARDEAAFTALIGRINSASK